MVAAFVDQMDTIANIWQAVATIINTQAIVFKDMIVLHRPDSLVIGFLLVHQTASQGANLGTTLCFVF